MRGGRGAEAAAAERERANGPGCGGGSCSHARALPSRTGCDAKRDGMRQGRGGGSGAAGAAQAGSHPCPFHPRALRALRVKQAQHSTACFYSLSGLCFPPLWKPSLKKHGQDLNCRQLCAGGQSCHRRFPAALFTTLESYKPSQTMRTCSKPHPVPGFAAALGS